MRNVDRIKQEILSATQDVSGLEALGRRLAAANPREFGPHLRNGIEHDTIGQSYLDDQIKLFFAYAPDRSFWEELDRRVKILTSTEQSRPSVIFGEWSYIGISLNEVEEAFGWSSSQPVDLSSTTFRQRLSMVNSMLINVPAQQLATLEAHLGREESQAASSRAGGCYVATAVYGSYEAPEVRVLREWRDLELRSRAIGRVFIRLYYAVSPSAVRVLGRRTWFTQTSRLFLDRFVARLRRDGYSGSTALRECEPALHVRVRNERGEGS